MVKPQKYLFDTDFGPPRIKAVDMNYVADEDEIEAPPPEPAPPPPPTFSEEELTLAREQAFEAGRQSGLQEAANTLEHMVGMAMASCTHHLQGSAAAQETANELQGKYAISVALAVIRKLQPQFCRQFGLLEIEGAVKEALINLDQVPRVTIKVHPELVEALREKSEILAAQASFEGKLIVTGDPTLAPGDCKIDWGDGGAARDLARIQADIDRAVETALGALNILAEQA